MLLLNRGKNELYRYPGRTASAIFRSIKIRGSIYNTENNPKSNDIIAEKKKRNNAKKFVATNRGGMASTIRSRKDRLDNSSSIFRNERIYIVRKGQSITNNK